MGFVEGPKVPLALPCPPHPLLDEYEVTVPEKLEALIWRFWTLATDIFGTHMCTWDLMR
jgi:hypothetical protein